MSQLNQLFDKALEILKTVKERRSISSVQDVFFGMYNDGNFDGIGDEYGFEEFVITNYQECGLTNNDLFNDIKEQYQAKFGKRKKGKVAYTTVTVFALLCETEKGYCFSGGKIHSHTQYGIRWSGIWVPKSQVTYNVEDDTITLPVWLAIEKNYMRTN